VGTRETFERLYRVHAGTVKTYAMRRLGSEPAADEIVSDVFLVLWRRLEEVPDDPLPWLLGVARNAVANHHRSERRAVALSARIAGLAERPGAAAAAPATGLLDRDAPVLTALAQLSARDQELLLLVAWEGLEPAQLATVLGISHTAAKVRLHRARRRLTAKLPHHPHGFQEATR
jgi:RNA polymerase sigma factor (sigma-70 family)